MLSGIDPANFRQRTWRRILGRAGIGHRAYKDTRDTFASHLLTAGISLGYVSQQLGHADAAVTARHYAKWIGGATYQQPLRLEPGEVPADLFAGIAPTDWPQFGPSNENGADDEIANPALCFPRQG